MIILQCFYYKRYSLLLNHITIEIIRLKLFVLKIIVPITIIIL